MTFRDYWHDHRGSWLTFCLGLILFCLGLWLDPAHRISLGTIGYMAGLIALLALAFTLVRWRAHNRFLTAVAARLAAGPEALTWELPIPANREQALIARAYNQVLAAHRQAETQQIAATQDQKEFIDAWVHEIKVPLAAATLLTDQLADGHALATQDDLALALSQVGDYVDQVLYYSRLDSFSKDYLLQTTALKPVINETVVAMRTSFIMAHLRFALTGPDVNVLTDPKWLRFILAQLLSNAVKYTPADGQVTVTLAAGAAETTVTVTDTGIGIPAAELAQVFDKGFTGTNGRSANRQSTGLGLYLAAQLATKLGHTLTITSQPGRGTAVTIHFPKLTYFGTEVQHD